jgi:hypothetical protein
VVGENKVEDAIKKAVTGAAKQTARDLDVDPKDIDKTLQARSIELPLLSTALAPQPHDFAACAFAFTAVR